MDCAEIRDAFTRGIVTEDAAVQQHLAECAHCRELFEREASLGHSLASAAALTSPLPDDLFASIEATVANEKGLRAWLRSRPSKQRFLAVVLSVVAAVCIGGVFKLRVDFAAYPRERLLVILLAYGAGILLSFRKELFSSLRRSSLVDHFGILLAALALPFVIALAPATEASRQLGPEGAWRCFGYGALLTLPTAALLWAFDRDDQLSVRTVWLSAAALGLSANLLLELHCGNGNLMHVLLGHASLGVAWLAVWTLTRRFSSASE